MKTFVGVFFGVIFALILGFVGCTALVGTAVDEVDKELNKVETVTLEATGAGSVSYSDNGNHVIGEPFEGVWTKEVGWGAFDWFTVHDDFMNPGPVSCKIIVDGVVVSEQHSTEASVTCNR